MCYDGFPRIVHMVLKSSMSRCSKYPILAILLCFGPLGVVGIPTAGYGVEEAIRAEIVYRASFGRADDIRLLVDKGASPNQPNADGVPIIAVAAVRSDPEALNVIKMLIELRANINAADPKGQNALFYAARAGNVDVVNLLLAYKIDNLAFDANGDTARTVATKSGHQDVVFALDDFAQNKNVRVNEIRKEMMLKKQQQKSDNAQKAANIEKALQQVGTDNADKTATAPATATSPAVATSPATKETEKAPPAATEPKTAELVAITDKKSAAATQEKIESAAKLAAKTPEASVNGDAVQEPEEIDEKKLEMQAMEQHNQVLAQIGKEPDPLTPDQQKEFDAIIKNGADTQLDTPPLPANGDNATFPMFAEAATAVATPALPAKTPEDLAAEIEKAHQETEKAQRLKEERDQLRKQELKNMAYDVAFHTCAFQYWAYVMQVRQSSELGSEELTISIQSHKDAAEALQRKLVVDYHMPTSFYDNIISSAQLRIYSQLNGMPSNRMRHEHNVGKMDDMHVRCEEISRQWGFPARLKTKQEIDAGHPNGFR